MDNLTHSLFGAALAYAGLNEGLSSLRVSADNRGEPSPGAPGITSRPAITLLSVIAANLPDLDIITTPWPLLYLEHHRGYTHTFWGIILLSLLVPLPFLKLSRGIRLTALPFRRKYGYLALVALIGSAGHVFLDFTNSYGVRPARPFVQRWIYGDFIPIVDPWIYLILGTAIFWIHSRGLRRCLLWAAGTGLLSFVVLLFGRETAIDPIRVVRVVWFAWIPVAWLLRRLIVTRIALLSRRIAVGSLMFLAAYYIFCWQTHRSALDALKRDVVHRFWHEDTPPRLSAIPIAGNPFLWTFFLDAPKYYYTGQFHLFDGRVFAFRIVSKNLTDIPFEKTRATCSGKVIMRFARYPFLEWKAQPDGWTVSIKDLRFAMPRTVLRTGFATIAVPFDKEWHELPGSRPLCPWSEAF